MEAHKTARDQLVYSLDILLEKKNNDMKGYSNKREVWGVGMYNVHYVERTLDFASRELLYTGKNGKGISQNCLLIYNTHGPEQESCLSF